MSNPLLDAITQRQILAAAWEEVKGEGKPPTNSDLAQVLADAPQSVREDAGARLTALLGGEGDTPWRMIVADGDLVCAIGPLDAGGPATPEARTLNIERMHREWVARRRRDGSAGPKHPLGPLIRAWKARPVEVQSETRRDKRILPRIDLREVRPERIAGQFFGGALGPQEPPPELPLFPEAPRRKEVPLLDMVDAAGLPVMAKGRGVPLPTRLMVRALASVRPVDRSHQTVRLAVTLAELRDGLFGSGWRVGQHWPDLLDALRTMHNYAIRGEWVDGRRGLWFPATLRHLPDMPNRNRPDMTALVVFDIAFPPGCTSGPAVALPDLDTLSRGRAPRYRAYIAAHSLAWQPGTTRVPAPRAGRRIRLWTRRLEAYPVLTFEDRRRLAFGPNDSKHRTKASVDEVWRDLPGLAVVGKHMVNQRTGEVGWRVLPTEAAGAILGGQRNA